MDIKDIGDYAKIYRKEIGRLRRLYPNKYLWLDFIVLFPRWYSSLNSGTSPIQDQIPWLTFPAIAFLKKALTDEMIVYEFGSGGSTLFFAQNVNRVYSVEHDRKWFLAVSSALRSKGCTNWSGRLIEPVYDGECAEKSPSDPDAYVSGSPHFVGYSFKSYAESVETFSDEQLDLVLIDGRARPSCFRHAVKKVKKGGFLVLDNAERIYYSYIHECLNSDDWIRYDFYAPGPYNSYFWQTCVWQRIR